ncbi:MAG: metallophosphoesterase [bacterium]
MNRKAESIVGRRRAPKPSLTIAIVADLHCHLRSLEYGQESFLLVGSPRIPPSRHPIQSLVDLVRPVPIRADLLVCPGDVTNRASPEGLSQGMEFLLELKRELRCSSLLCTLGNHDVNSMGGSDGDHFLISRTAHPCFPLEEEQKDDYWAHGFSIIPADKHSLLLMLNTVADHRDEKTAKRGAFSDDRLYRLDVQLTNVLRKKSFSFRIAVLHHHPLLHSHISYLSGDVLGNGDQLIEILAKHKFDLILHGHKHQPRLRRQSVGGRNMLVLAAGSFSAFLGDLWSTTRNLFHILTLDKPATADEYVASLRTWEYNHGLGWNPAARRSAGLPHIVKFMGSVPSIPKEDVLRFLEAEDPQKVNAPELFRAFPALEYLLPDEMESFGGALESEYGFRFVYDEFGQLYEVGRVVRKS